MLKKYLFAAIVVTAILCLGLQTYSFTRTEQTPEIEDTPVTVPQKDESTATPSTGESPGHANSPTPQQPSSGSENTPGTQENQPAPTSTEAIPQPPVQQAPASNQPVPVQPAPEIQYYTDDDDDQPDLEEDDDDDD